MVMISVSNFFQPFRSVKGSGVGCAWVGWIKRGESAEISRTVTRVIVMLFLLFFKVFH